MKFLVTGVNGQWGHDVMNENYIKEDMKVSAQILLKLMPVLFMVRRLPQSLTSD